MYKTWRNYNAINAAIFKRFNTTSVKNEQRVLKYFGSLPKSISRKPLNFSFREYDIDEKAANNVFKLRNDDSIVFLNLFIQTVLRNDFHKSKEMLNRRMVKIKANLTLNNINMYYSCLSILVLHTIQLSSEITIFDLKELIDDFESFESIKKVELPVVINEHREKIKVNFIRCLLHMMRNNRNSNKIIKNKVLQYISKTIKSFKLTQQKLSEGIVNDEEYNQVAKLLNLKERKINGTYKYPSKIPETSIQDYKDSMGFVSFDNICRYISDCRYDAHDDESKRPMYEIYDSLNKEESEKFINNYLLFNRHKELNIEDNCLNLVENLDTETRNSKSKIFSYSKLTQNHSEIITSWINKSSEKLNTKINKIELKPDSSKEHLTNSLEEYILMKWKAILNLIPKNVLSTLIISELLSHTVSTENGQIRLIDLANSISLAIKRLALRDHKYKHIVENINSYFSEDFSMQLSSTLLKIVIEECKIPESQINMNSFQNSLALIEDFNYKELNYFFTKVNNEYPGFQWSIQSRTVNKVFKKVGVIQIHPFFLEEFKFLKSLTVSKSLYFPMLCPPKPWISPKNGGYLKDLSPITKSSDIKTTLYYLNKAHKTGQLDPLYNSLNILGSTAWAINNNILRVFNLVMKNDDGFLKIPPNLKSIKVNKPNEPNLKEYSNEIDFKKALYKYKADLTSAIQNFHNLKSQRIEFNMLQKMANGYGKNGDMLYFPHNVDFRGRAYPMVSLLTHYQGDLVRSLLMFWYGRPLGPNGFNWIKYQLAGVYGMDKLPYHERLKFVESNLDLILDSARDPLNGKMWWKYAENPWQSLSLCIEIMKILDYKNNGGDLEKYICRIPIHQDGSCNGLQHYAALGKDKEGGLSVNLISKNSDLSMPIRGDVYSDVLAIVKTRVLKDLNNSNHENNVLAKIALPILNRKLIKQTVMTTVYGVTAFGGAAQIHERIKDIISKSIIFRENNLDIGELSQFQRKVAIYLSKLVLDSVSELFGGAKLIQDWLSNNCFRIINSFDYSTVKYAKTIHHKDFDFFQPLLYKPMMWTTLSGFPVIQLYKNTKSTSIETPFQRLSISKPNKFATINTRKQMNAIAPNFIHSIDSLHMLMTSISVNNNNIQFVSVHDSFWTYPKDVSKLSEIIREEFVKLHSTKIIENMYFDLCYTSEKSFQLVWVEKSGNEEFLHKLQLIRDDYIKKGFICNSNLNSVLDYELKYQTENKKNIISELVDNFKPKLYFRSRKSALLLELYNDETNQGENFKKLSKSKFTPILVPLKILQTPPTGDLDINEVRNSIYFFS